MAYTFRCAVLFSLAVAFPAAAQTTLTPGTVTVNGVVNVGIGTPNPTASTTTANPAAAAPATPTATTGASGAASTAAATSTAGAITGPAGATANARPAPSSQGTSGGSSGSAPAAPSIRVPAWVLCSPSGASGMQPFLTGTELSCAP